MTIRYSFRSCWHFAYYKVINTIIALLSCFKLYLCTCYDYVKSKRNLKQLISVKKISKETYLMITNYYSLSLDEVDICQAYDTCNEPVAMTPED